jgi:predicted RNase H-like HicB family nuclease
VDERQAKEAFMATLNAVEEHVARAENLPEVLDAAYEAFEAMLAVIRQHDDPSNPLFVPMVLAAGSTANGRDNVLFAPSLPPRPLHRDVRAEDGAQPVAAHAAAV